ncbi:hypothetical protein GPL15_05000 [Clostridium sp. MCC353]|uniref:hypothetical protein n=1 Tax=Clostridium sp. MCC353 TaxID=2592646 RepID=UPI001C03A349|nr:hypothetical protein [Clostridium sp. MCC353]MBT9775864.1 hypothetical protein [Clostridium sp. MCC353]
MKDSYENLLKEWKEFKKTHIKVRNEKMFKWFNEKGLKILQEYKAFYTVFYLF